MIDRLHRSRKPWVLVSLAIFAIGCQGAAAKHESLGDEAYVRGQFETAFAEYRLAAGERPAAVLRAKTGMAALNAGALSEAAAEFTLLGQTYADRAIQAADGLERVAEAAARETNADALRQALSGLQSVAEGRAIGAFARELANNLGDAPNSPEALDILAYAAAAAPDVDQQDSLMFAYSEVLRRLGRCAAAVPVLESLVRRGRVTRMVAQARTWAAGCAITIGRQELDSRRLETATKWFARAILLDTDTGVARTARIAMGDALAGQGDFAASLDAYQRARDGLSEADTLYTILDRKINSVFDARRTFR